MLTPRRGRWYKSRMRQALPTLILLALGCTSEVVGVAREPVIFHANEVTIGTLDAVSPGYYASGTSIPNGAQFDLRPMGVALEPSGFVAVAAPNTRITCSGSFPPLCFRREGVSAYVLDIAATVGAGPFVRSSSPDVLGSGPIVSTPLINQIRGMSATPFADASGNVDALFLFTAAGTPATIRAFSFEGEAANPIASSVSSVSGISSLLDHRAVPALAYGQDGSAGKIFMAYAAPVSSGGVPHVHAGFLTRSGSSWTFTQTASIRATNGTAGAVYHALVADYDANTREFAVAWQFDESNYAGRLWTAYMQRFTWTGAAVGSRFEAHGGVDASHSGAQLSFNRDSSRYHFLFQHNSALVERTAPGLTCARNSSGNCSDAQTCVARGNRTTTETNYIIGPAGSFGWAARV